MAWTLTRGLQNLRSQVNTRFPDRDKASDGTIGDAAHQPRTSGHNPDDTAGSMPAWNADPDTVPEVRAWDMDSDLGEPGASAQMVVDHIRRLAGLAGVIRYMIYDGHMYHARDGFAPTAFDGDPHTNHIHFEGAWTQAADDDTTFDYRLEEINMPTADEIAAAVWAYRLQDPASTTTPKATKAAGDWQRYNDIVARVGARDAVVDLLLDGSHAARTDDIYQQADAATQKRMRNVNDALRLIVGGPVSQADILAAIQANRVDPATVIAGVLAGLGPSSDPQQIAAAVVAALPALPGDQTDQAKAFADELAARLAA